MDKGRGGREDDMKRGRERERREEKEREGGRRERRNCRGRKLQHLELKTIPESTFPPLALHMHHHIACHIVIPSQKEYPHRHSC